MKSTVHKPWGKYDIISQGKNFLVKKILVNPRGKLSLQSHQHRSENWMVVQGKAEVVLNDQVFELEEGKSIFIPTKSKHSLANKYAYDLVVIEIWYGNKLSEEDIIRYEDIYGRI